MSGKETIFGCIYPLFPCLYTLTADEAVRRQRSDDIDRQIARDKDGHGTVHRLLLLGAGESGKSTIIKQMQLIHLDKFSETVRQERRRDIRHNLQEAIVSILSAMSTIVPPEKLDNQENEQMADWILKNATKRDFEFSPEFYKFTDTLWKDTGVKKTFLRSNEYQLIDSAKYFLDKLHLISKDNYIPTDQDILRCRVLTTGIYELTFEVNNVRFRMIDVGGQRGERRKWFLCFNDVTAIIFITACSSYDMVLREDESKNRLKESLELFKIVWNNRWLRHIPVILFLNKQDIFREKILSGRSRLEDYFPEYIDYETPADATGDPAEHPEVLRAKYFIKSKFEDIASSERIRFYYRFTCAVDTDNIKRVFKFCRDSIQRKFLKEYDLI